MSLRIEEILENCGSLVQPTESGSMLPLLRPGKDLIVVEKRGEERFACFDIVLFRQGKKCVLHRILQVFPDGYYIAGDLCVKGCLVREEQILGVLTAVVRDGKTIPVSDPGYQRYVRFWCGSPLRRRLLIRLASVFYRLKRIGKR